MRGNDAGLGEKLQVEVTPIPTPILAIETLRLFLLPIIPFSLGSTAHSSFGKSPQCLKIPRNLSPRQMHKCDGIHPMTMRTTACSDWVPACAGTTASSRSTARRA